MDAKGILFKELVKNGYAKFNGNRLWDISNRSFLYLTPEMTKGFIDLLNYEPYKKNVFEVELKLIKDNAQKFVEEIGQEKPFNLIDIECGNGIKAKEFIKALKGKPRIRYCPVGYDCQLMDLAISNIKKEKFVNIDSYKPIIADYETLEELAPKMRSNEFQKNVILLHGSVLASYEINDFLFKISKSMFPKDCIIIGNGIRTGERLAGLEKYKHKAFDSWLIHLIRLLGFNDNEVEYDARFNEIRVEGFYKIKADKKIRYRDKEVKFKKGDEILVAILYKYYFEELEKFFKIYFCDVKMIKDKNDEYSLALCKK